MCTLLAFDSRQHALPVAWIITRSSAKPDVAKWMKALLGRASSVEPGWKINGFLIDDAAAETDPIRQDKFFSEVCFNVNLFMDCRVILCLQFDWIPGIYLIVLYYFPSGVFVDHG